MTGIRNRQRKIQLKLIYLAFPGLNAQSLPGLHSFSGADIIGIVASWERKVDFLETI